MQTIFSKFSDNIKKISIDEFWADFWENNLDYDNKITASQKKRIRNTGKDIFGDIIRTFGATGTNVYALTTLEIKSQLRQRTDIVTLTDTGQFLEKDVNLEFSNGTAFFDVNDKKPDGNISDNVDLKPVFGWSDSDIEVLIHTLLPEFKKYLLSIMLNR